MTQPDHGAQSGTTDPQSGVGENGSGNGNGDANNGSTSTGSQTGAQSGTQDSGTTNTVDKAELDRVTARMKAADQRASQLEAELRQIKDKDLPEVDKLKRDHAEALEKLEKASARVAEMALSNAFLTDNTYKWKNPATALKLLDRTKVTVEEDGSVSGMKDALKALATSDPYLLDDTKTEDSPKDDTPPGTAPGNNGGSGKGKDPKATQQRRFPAMRTRF